MNSNNIAPIPVGFRFHPTDEELVGYYLLGKVGRTQRDHLIQELDLYKIEPWDLSEVCRIREDAPENQSDWYFFSHKDKKYPTGNRANRATTAGFWKATGRDKPIHTQRQVIGMRKTLVFYKGRAPHGEKTDWIMHEFRLDEGPGIVPNYEADGWVVCRVFRKTKIFRSSRSQDTSCSFEEDQQVSHLLQPEPRISPDKFSGHAGSDGRGGSDGYPPPLHHHFAFTCKQEMSLADYGNPATSHADPFVDNLQHLEEIQRFESAAAAAGHHFLAPCSSSTFSRGLQQACTSGRRDMEYPVEVPFHMVDTSIKELEDARSSVTQEGCFPVLHGEEYWPLEGSRDMRLVHPTASSCVRRDQSLADVTCHVQLKRQPSDHLSSNHEMVELWNV